MDVLKHFPLKAVIKFRNLVDSGCCGWWPLRYFSGLHGEGLHGPYDPNDQHHKDGYYAYIILAWPGMRFLIYIIQIQTREEFKFRCR